MSLDHINEGLRSLARPIEWFKFDARNARVHPDKNIKAIAHSLKQFGQQKPIVALNDGTVIAGNGTLWAAQKTLDWTHLAAVVFQE